MLEEHRTLVDDNEAELVSMDAGKMLTQLMRRGILDHEDYQVVNSRPTSKGKNTEILQQVKKRGPTAFDIFFQALNSIDERHVSFAEKLQPVRHRVLWFTSSPKHAAAVSYALEKYAHNTLSMTEGRKSQRSYLLRRGRIFKRDISSKARKLNCDAVRLAQDIELYLAFPISERGDTPRKALRGVFEALGAKMDVAIMSGVCVGVRNESTGEDLGVRGGEVVLATEAITVEGGRRELELPLSSALAAAKTHLSQLPEKKPLWFKEAEEHLANIPNREHPRLVPHYDSIRQTTDAAAQQPRALASDVDTFPFYDLCTQYLGVEKPWFSCKGAISYAMLNNMDPTQESSCALVSSFFAMEACWAITNKLRQTQS